MVRVCQKKKKKKKKKKRKKKEKREINLSDMGPLT